LLQVRGNKTVHLFDGNDRSLLSEQELERFYGGSHRNLVFKEPYQAKAQRFLLKPGDGLHFPVTAPHHVQVEDEVSISFSITFRTPDLERRSIIYNVNAYLRGKGWRPTPVGQSRWRDALKYCTYRVWRRARRLFGKPLP
jgi:ribosomal protein L16 Arg81 hydroxylase